MTAEHTSCEFDPHATSMGDEVAPEVYEELFAMRRSIDNFDAALAKESSLDPEFAEKFLNFIISEVIRHHVRIANEHADHDKETEKSQS